MNKQNLNYYVIENKCNQVGTGGPCVMVVAGPLTPMQ